VSITASLSDVRRRQLFSLSGMEQWPVYLMERLLLRWQQS
jgi:hypothetical protein